MTVALLAITSGGRQLAERLAEKLPESVLLTPDKGVGAALAANWQEFEGFVCVMAAGIVVRAIAPLLKDKKSDPCVLVLDEKGRHVISLLSGHLGGGNELARKVAALVGGEPVITTASDTLGLPALDIWAREQQLFVEKREELTRVSAQLVNTGEVKIFSEVEVCSLPSGLVQVFDHQDADIIVSPRLNFQGSAALFRPRNLVIGIGCNRNTPAKEFEEALAELLEANNLSRASIRNLASINVKDNEAGLLAFAEQNGWQIEFYDKDELNSVGEVAVSPAAMRAVGAVGVAEPAALLSAQNNDLLVGKRKWQNVTMAVAVASFTLSAQAPDRSNI